VYILNPEGLLGDSARLLSEPNRYGTLKDQLRRTISEPLRFLSSPAKFEKAG